RLSALADAHGASWSPHTWSHGHGLLANLHVALAVSSNGYLEVPYDPPGWTPERRDFPLPSPVEVAGGMLLPPEGPGLGADPDLDALERWRGPRARCRPRPGRVRALAGGLGEPLVLTGFDLTAQGVADVARRRRRVELAA